MEKYYVAFQTRSQAFLMEQRMRGEGIRCEITYLPREIMKDLCNMGLRFDERQYDRAINLLRRSGLPGFKVYQETAYPGYSTFTEIII